MMLQSRVGATPTTTARCATTTRRSVVSVSAYHQHHHNNHHNNNHNNHNNGHHHHHNNNGHNNKQQRFKDSRALRDLKVKQNKHILSTYNKAYAFFPKVKFVLKHNSRMGEVWKLSGSAPGLGNWVPEVSPSLSWREGGVWSAEVALPPGHYSFKCMLRTADGNYVWEGGENRTITVPVKDRPGHFVMTYHMDVRAEPVDSLLGDSLAKQKGQAGTYSPMGAWNTNEGQREVLERAMANGRVPANAW